MNRFRTPIFFTLTALLLLPVSLKAQNHKEITDSYRRSSLCMILMADDSSPHKEAIMEAFLSQPVPDKYNDHNTGLRYFNPDEMTISRDDRNEYNESVDKAAASGEGGKRKKKGGFGSFMKGLAVTALAVAETSSSSSSSGYSSSSSSSTSKSPALIDAANKEDFAVKANKFLSEHHFAKRLFDKWFINDDGQFCMNMVQERGMYGATLADVATARSSARGLAMLKDAGEELINNTFIVISRYRYMSKEELSAELDQIANMVNEVDEAAGAIASLVSAASSISLGAGYYVRATSFLFKLRWNEEIAARFYSELWDNPDAYDASDLFELIYIGQESAFANVKAGVFTDKSHEELVRIATVNATDAVLAKLAKQYDVFKTKTPLLSVEPEIVAPIGMKEGVEPGDKFEVLERIEDPETGKTTYNRKGVIKAVRGKIWDNRYMPDQETQAEAEEMHGTVFEGSVRGLYPGMLIRQIK